MVKNPHLTQNGKILWKTEKFVRCPRSVFKLKLKFVFHTVPAGLIEYLSESSKITKWRHSRSSIGRPWRSSQNQKQKRKRRATTKPREVDCAISQSGLRSSQIISKIQKCQHSQTLLMTQIRNVAREPGSTAFVPTSRKIEIAKSASESGLRGLLAGSALAKPYSGAGKFGDLLTADHKVRNEGGESRNNHRCAVVVQELATQWIQSCPCKTKTSQETERSTKVSRAVRKAKSHLYWQFIGIWANPVKIYHGIIELRHIIELRRGYCWKSGTQNKRREVCVLLQSGLDEKWWADSMECYCYLRNVHDLLADGENTLRNLDLRNNLKAWSFRLTQWLNIILFPRRTSQGSTNLVRKVLNGMLLGYALFAEGNLKRRYIGCRHWGAGKFGRVTYPCPKAQCKGNNNAKKVVKNTFPVEDGTAKLSEGETVQFENPL